MSDMTFYIITFKMSVKNDLDAHRKINMPV